jgi:hypothetical protein
MGITVNTSDNRYSVRVGKQPTIVPSPVFSQSPVVGSVPTTVLNMPVLSPPPVVNVDVRVGPSGPAGPAGQTGAIGPQGPAGTGGGGGGGPSPTYDVITDLVSATTGYVGKADIGSVASNPVWQIQKMVMDSNGGVTLQWAGLAAFNQVWNNRTSLTYA